MRFANTSRILLPLAISAVLATSVMAQDDHPNIQPNAVRGQLKTAAPGQSPQSAPQSQAPPPAQPAAPAPAGTKAKAKSPDAAKAPAAAKAPSAAKAPEAPKDAKAAKAPAAAATAAKAPAKKVEAKPPKPPVEKPAAEKTVVKRDPFDTLLNKARAGGDAPANLPPGKAGLIVSTLRIDGIVRGPNNSMIAIVSNPQQRVYFLHEGDKLYDGSVDKITLDAVSFHEFGKDAFGKPLERMVAKRLYPSPGEQQ
jgi:hypothetical protein